MTTETLGGLYYLIAPTTMTTMLEVGLGLYLGAQLPDIDHPKTKINRLAGPLGKLLAKSGHRTYTHTIWAVLLLTTLTGLIYWHHGPHFIWMTLVGLTAGYFAHLLEDNLSIQGVLWFYPFQKFRYNQAGHPYKKRRKHWYYYRTGGTAETAWRTIFTITAYVVWLYIGVRWVLGLLS